MTTRVPPPPECSGFLYTVRPGDTLFIIANRFGVRLQDLINANPQLVNPALIFPGQHICIPFVEPACPAGFIYEVQQGDTLFAIAQRFGVTVQAILAVNPQIVNPALIFPGQPICIPTILQFPCCVILERTANVPAGARGSALIDQVGDTFRVTFAAVGLPDPSTFGNFDAYVGTLTFREADFSALLAPAQELDQPTVFAGALLLPAGLSPAQESLVLVSPFNTATDVTGPAVLRGEVLECT